MNNVSIWYDRKKSKCYFAKWRIPQPDGSKPKYGCVKITKRCDQYRSKGDVRKHPDYLALVKQLANGDGDPAHHKLLCAVAEVRGHVKPDAQDAAVVGRFTADDSADGTLLATFVEREYWPHAETTLRGKTVAEYKSMWNRYKIAERVAGLRVRDFRTKHGSSILQAIADDHDLSTRTLQHVKFLLSAVFVLAKNRGYFDGANPIEDVMLPKARSEGDTYAYDLLEILRILQLVPDDSTRAAVAIAAFAGLREGDFAGLEWADYDGNDIQVRRSIDRANGASNPPKTRKSAAPVPVIPTLKALLEKYRATTDARPDAPIFPGERQRYADLDKLALRVIRPAIEPAVTWHGWHSFRRGIASNLFALGADDLTVQRILRHAKVTVTREHYIKVRDAKVDAALAQYDAEIAKLSENRYAVQ